MSSDGVVNEPVIKFFSANCEILPGHEKPDKCYRILETSALFLGVPTENILVFAPVVSSVVGANILTTFQDRERMVLVRQPGEDRANQHQQPQFGLVPHRRVGVFIQFMSMCTCNLSNTINPDTDWSHSGG
jgi:hypothetical protein